MESQETSDGQYPQSVKLLSSKLLKCHSNAFKKHWNNTGAICWNVNFADLEHVFTHKVNLASYVLHN